MSPNRPLLRSVLAAAGIFILGGAAWTAVHFATGWRSRSDAGQSSVAQDDRTRPALPPVIPTEPRFALVVGNIAYPAAPLKNAVNDARAIAGLLRELGFTVTVVEDTRLADLDRAVQTFAGAITPGAVALFFYSGHGFQVDGENYLAPIDFEAADEVEARHRGLSAEFVREKLEGARARLTLIVLDACRNNPFRAVRSAAGGLAVMRGGVGTLIAMATAPGSTASDNPDGRNGLFTEHLLDVLQMPGLTLAQVFTRVRERVWEASGHQQLPYTTSGVIGDFVFRPLAAVASGAAPNAPGAGGAELSAVERAEQAEREGRLSEALAGYITALAAEDETSPEGWALRERIVTVSRKMTPPPAVPGDAESHATRGIGLLARGNDAATLREAERALHEALRAAPWYGAALHSLGVAETRLGKKELAIKHLELYLLTTPRDARATSATVTELKAAVERAVRGLRESCDGGDLDGPARDARACGTLARWVQDFDRLNIALVGELLAPPYYYTKACTAGDEEACASNLEYFEKPCQATGRVGCVELATIYLLGVGVKADLARAAETYDRACTSSELLGCKPAAVMFDAGLGVAADASKASDRYRRGCGGPAVSSCVWEYRDRDGASAGMDLPGPIRIAFYERLCAGAAPLGCGPLAELLEFGGAGVLKDEARAAALYERTCTEGRRQSCHRLGLMSEDGRGVPKDVRRAVTLFEGVCASDLTGPFDFAACMSAARHYFDGDGVAKDPAKAMARLQRACDAPGGTVRLVACKALGTEYLTGEHVAQDFPLAKAAVERACDGGDPQGCTMLGFMFARGTRGNGVGIDLTRAAGVFERACDGGAMLDGYDAAGCRMLAEMYEQGSGVAKDLSRARALYARACGAPGDARDEPACDALRRLQGQ